MSSSRGMGLRLIHLLKKDLAKEMSIWVDQQLISADQARSICRFYDVDYDTAQDHSTAYNMLIVLGFLFIGLALITIIGANWESIPRGLRMAGLLTLTAGTHGFATRYYLLNRVSLGTGLFFLGNLFYGASIILIAQIYHLGEHMPDGVFFWALGSLPFALLLRHTGLTFSSGLLALLWFCLEAQTKFLSSTFLVTFFSFISRRRVLCIGKSTNKPLLVSHFHWQSHSVVPDLSFCAVGR